MNYENITIEEAKKKIPFFAYFAVKDEHGAILFEYEKTKMPEVNAGEFFSEKLDEVIKSDAFKGLLIRAADKKGDASNRPAYTLQLRATEQDENGIFPFILGNGKTKDLSNASNFMEMLQIMNANMDLKLQKTINKLEIQNEKDKAESERKYNEEILKLERKMYEDQKKRDQEELQKVREELAAKEEELEEKRKNALGGVATDLAKLAGMGAMEALGNIIMKNFGLGALGTATTTTTTTTNTPKDDTPAPTIEELDFSKTEKEDKNNEENEEEEELTEDEELVLEAFHSLKEAEKREMLKQSQEIAKNKAE